MFKKVLIIEGFTTEEELLEQIDGLKPNRVILNKFELRTSQIGNIITCLTEHYNESDFTLEVAETHNYKP